MAEERVQRDPLALLLLQLRLAGRGTAAHGEVGGVGRGAGLEHKDLLPGPGEVQRGHQARGAGAGDGDVRLVGPGSGAEARRLRRLGGDVRITEESGRRKAERAGGSALQELTAGEQMSVVFHEMTS